MSRPRTWTAPLAGCSLAVLVALGAVLGVAPTAWAATPTPTLRLVAEAAPHDPHAIELLATVEEPHEPAASGPGPLAGIQVSFSVHLSQFAGAPLLALGTAKTNAAGVATLAYRPTWTARQSFVATASDAAGATLASATASFVATSASHPFAGTVQALRPDGSIGRAVTGVLLGVVALLWIALLAVVVRVNLGLRARGR